MSAAFQLVLAVQLDLHIALSLNAQGGISFVVIIQWVSGAAHIDLYVSQGELQHLIGKVVDHRNGVAKNAISLSVHRSRGCRSSSRGCLLGLGLLPGAFLLFSALLPVGVLRLLGVLLPVGVLRLLSALLLVVVLRLVGVLRLLSVLLPVSVLRLLGALRLVCIFRFLSVLRLVGVLRLLSVLRLGRLVVVLYHRAKAGVLCCRAFQVALLRGDGLLTGGDDDLTTVILGRSVLLDGLAMLIFGDGNIAVVDIVNVCKGRSRQRHCDAQRYHQSCCPAECAVLFHGGFLSFSTLSCAFCALF